LAKNRSEIKYRNFKIHINNARVNTASGITHELYEMVDKQELYSVSIDGVRKSKHSVEVIFGLVVGFAVAYVAGKIVDIPYNHAIKKIITMLKKWKRTSPQSTLDIFFNNEKIE